MTLRAGARLQTMLLTLSLAGLAACGRDAERSRGSNVATTHAVVITAVLPDHKIRAIRAVREETDLGLAEAKELVESLPATLKEGLALAEARALVQRLEQSGIKAEIR